MRLIPALFNFKPEDLREAQFIELLKNVSILRLSFVPHYVDARVRYLCEVIFKFKC